jgi:hypothetical protein
MKGMRFDFVQYFQTIDACIIAYDLFNFHVSITLKITLEIKSQSNIHKNRR